MFKFIILLILWGTVTNAQDCGSYTSEDQSRPVSITIYSPAGECFDVIMQGVKVNPEKATRIQLTVNYGVVPIMVKLDNGNIINKNLLMGDTYVSANYKIITNRRGKYKLRLEPFSAVTSGPSASERVAEMQAKSQAKLKAEQDARDKEWNDKIAKKEAEREERRAAERAKEKAEEEAREKERKARWAADSEKRRRENPGRQGATYDTNRQGRQGATYDTNRQGRQGATYDKSRNSRAGSSKANSSAPPREIAENEKDGKKYFDDYRKGHQVEFSIAYRGEPACDWEVEIILGDVVVAKGKTDGNGKFSSTYYGLLGRPFKVVAKRENADWGARGSWSVQGYWYLAEREYQAGKMDLMKLELFEEYASESMGVNIRFGAYGISGNCK